MEHRYDNHIAFVLTFGIGFEWICQPLLRHFEVQHRAHKYQFRNELLYCFHFVPDILQYRNRRSQHWGPRHNQQACQGIELS